MFSLIFYLSRSGCVIHLVCYVIMILIYSFIPGLCWTFVHKTRFHFHTQNSISGNYTERKAGGREGEWGEQKGGRFPQRIIIKVFTAVKNDLTVYVLHFLWSRFGMGLTLRTRTVHRSFPSPGECNAHTLYQMQCLQYIYLFITFVYINLAYTHTHTLRVRITVLYGQRLLGLHKPPQHS